MTTNIIETMTLANLIRAYHGALTRNQLKVARARLRRHGATNLNNARRNAPYHVAPAVDHAVDARAEEGTVLAQVVAMGAVRGLVVVEVA